MNNLKKIGLTALAGSLVATSVAYSGELAVSGSASMNFKNYSDSSTGKAVRMGNSVFFKGSGETDGGLNVNLSFELDQGTPSGDGPFDSHFVSVGNDTLGTLTVHGHGGSNSAAALDTTAAGDLWDNTLMSTVATPALGRNAPFSSTSGNNLMVYSLPTMIDGLAVAGSYQAANTTGTGSTAYGLTYTGLEGLSVSYGAGESEDVAGAAADQNIYKASYVYGSVTAGVSYNDYDSSTNSYDQTVTAFGLSYTVSDQISVSYGEETIDRADKHEDIEVAGVSVSYTTGGMTASVSQNEAKSSEHTANMDKEMWNIGLSFAF